MVKKKASLIYIEPNIQSCQSFILLYKDRTKVNKMVRTPNTKAPGIILPTKKEKKK